MAGRRALSSAFAGRLEGFIAYKRDELNCKATNEEDFYAPSFDRFCRERYPDREELDMELAIAWVSESGGPFGKIGRASVMREFARYLILEGQDAFVLPGKVTPIRPGAPAPHIFTQPELDAFFGAADALTPAPSPGFGHLEAPVYFRLLYCAGLRPYEARSLPVARFDLGAGIVRVVDSKGRDRDVPVHADVADLCRAYSEEMDALLPGRTAFFPGETGTESWSHRGMYETFWRCWGDAGVTEFAGPRPRPYDFRHSFATECIRRWLEEGVDVGANIKFLQEYMGHADLDMTMYYVHLVRGGLGDPTRYDTWEPPNRARKEGHCGEIQGS